MIEWTEDKILRLRQLVAEGLTSSAIAERFGVSRSAIIGKCHRLGLALKGAPANLPKTFEWTPERLEMLRAGMDEGLMVPALAARLGCSQTRIYRQIRQGDSVLRQARATRTIEDRPISAARSPRRITRVDPGAPSAALRVLFTARLARHCAWVVDTSAPIATRLVCGAEVEPGSSWCAHHACRVFVKREVAA